MLIVQTRSHDWKHVQCKQKDLMTIKKEDFSVDEPFLTNRRNFDMSLQSIASQIIICEWTREREISSLHWRKFLFVRFAGVLVRSNRAYKDQGRSPFDNRFLISTENWIDSASCYSSLIFNIGLFWWLWLNEAQVRLISWMSQWHILLSFRSMIGEQWTTKQSLQLIIS